MRFLCLLFLLSLASSLSSTEDEWWLDTEDVQTSKNKADEKHIEVHEETIPPGNWTRFELKWAGPMRLIVHSLKGDADIYISYTEKYVHFDMMRHNSSSSTCGLDYLDVPDVGLYSSRPVYLGIYAHPSKPSTSYQLAVVMASNGTRKIDFEPSQIKEVFHQQKPEQFDRLLSFLEVFIQLILEILVSLL